MAFVDGENFTLCAQRVAEQKGASLIEGDYYQKDVFVWFPKVTGRANLFTDPPLKLQPTAIRAFYYASSQGDEPRLAGIREALWKLGFNPHVFKREGGAKRSKGVDIALAKDFLCNAFYGNYDVAVLFAGDGDYVPMVDEVKRMGKVVYVATFYGSGLSPALRLAADECFGLDAFFCDKWRTADGDIPKPETTSAGNSPPADSVTDAGN